MFGRRTLRYFFDCFAQNGHTKCGAQICRQIYLVLPPNVPVFSGKLTRKGGKTSTFTGGARRVHRTGEVLTQDSGGDCPHRHNRIIKRNNIDRCAALKLLATDKEQIRNGRP